MDGVLNEVTNTVHKHDVGKSALATECGSTLHVSHESLTRTSLGAANASKCGRCFEDAGGY